TRDLTLHAIEQLARRSGLHEIDVTRTLLALMQRSPGDRGAEAGRDAGHWLRGAGRRELVEQLDLQDTAITAWRRLRHRAALPVYLGTLAAGTLGLIAWIMARHGAALPSDGAPLWLTLLAATLMLVPASEAVVAVINRLISESTRASRLPRLALAHGIPPEHQ